MKALLTAVVFKNPDGAGFGVALTGSKRMEGGAHGIALALSALVEAASRALEDHLRRHPEVGHKAELDAMATPPTQKAH